MNPWDKHAEDHDWDGRLQRLDPAGQVSIAAACLERSLPFYLAWAERYDPETGRAAAKGLELLWQVTYGEQPRERGRVFDTLCEHDPAETSEDLALDRAAPNAWEALRLALEATLQEDSTDLIQSSIEYSYHAVDRPLIQQAEYSNYDQLRAQLAADDRIKTEIAFQEAALTEVETTVKPLTRDRALDISRSYRTGPGVQREL